MSTLSDDQRTLVRGWIENGAGLSELQTRLKQDLDVSLTYLEARLLLDDLKLQIKDPDPAPAESLAADLLDDTPEPAADLPAPGLGGGRVAVKIDTLMKPGTMLSGKVTFSDGNAAEWNLDQTGRLGLNPDTPGYRPTPQDVQSFQVELERLARTQGF